MFCKKGGVGSTWVEYSNHGALAHRVVTTNHWHVRAGPPTPLLQVTLLWEVRLKLTKQVKQLNNHQL